MAEGILGEIEASKRAELAARFDGVAIDALRARAVPTCRGLAGAIAQPGARFILEIKKASPSAGAIRPNADPVALARGYAGVADALSVLCDGPYFGGSLDDLAAARAHFEGPILAKDFFIDLRQVAEARIVGADAVLVMISLLDDEAVRAMIAEARRFGMDALVEVHDESEMQRALALGAPLIGINNRDLRDLSIDLATTEKLARMAPDQLVISESGIQGGADVERLAGKVDGFLIGSALMGAADPALAARAMIFGRVKVCGLRRSGDVAPSAPATFAGFVFAPETPRHITAEAAAPLAGLARQAGMLPVGVFRDAPASVVSDIAMLLNLHAVQLHGHEEETYICALRRELPRGCEIWRAVSVGRDPLSDCGADRMVFDNADGGSGQSFDWRLIAKHRQFGTSVVAGGIGPDNARAARALGAYAIDVGSRVESSPGVKSGEKLHALFESLRPRSREGVRQCA